MNATQTILTTSNTKLAKGEQAGFLTYGIHLAPATLAHQRTVCPWASPGCQLACLNTAGRGIMRNVQAARIKKTLRWHDDRAGFLAQLHDEIAKAIKSADRKGMTPCFRLNLTSDIPWEKHGIPQCFPDVQFYDYTKGHIRYTASFHKAWPSNYHLTYSRSETTPDAVVRTACKRGGNVAAVFRGKLPKTWLNIPVIDGDSNDLRFLDTPGCIVGLVEKGMARRDDSGFVIG